MASNRTRSATSGIGQVAEGRQVFPTLTVLENLEMGAMLPRARAGARKALGEVFAMFPRLAERRDQLAGTMSGGEQQMLAIGRCLMGEPELIMFDEPSLGLAPLGGAGSAAHHPPAEPARHHHPAGGAERRGVAEMSNRAYVLENGRIVMSGPGRVGCCTTTGCVRPTWVYRECSLQRWW